MVIIQRRRVTSVDKDVEKLQLSYIVDTGIKWFSCFVNILAIPQKVQ
jgi:hypothetical protein